MWCFVNMLLVAYWAPLKLLFCLCTLPCHASLNRTCIILDCASCHEYACVFTMLFASFRYASLVCFGFVPELWGFVRLRPFVFFMDSFSFLAGSQARWPYPRNHFYLCLLVACSFAMPRYLPIAISCLPNCHVNPLTHRVLANHCLAMLPLCSAPLIALLVAGEGGVCSMLEHGYCWDIVIISCIH